MPEGLTPTPTGPETLNDVQRDKVKDLLHLRDALKQAEDERKKVPKMKRKFWEKGSVFEVRKQKAAEYWAGKINEICGDIKRTISEAQALGVTEPVNMATKIDSRLMSDPAGAASFRRTMEAAATSHIAPETVAAPGIEPATPAAAPEVRVVSGPTVSTPAAPEEDLSDLDIELPPSITKSGIKPGGANLHPATPGSDVLDVTLDDETPPPMVDDAIGRGPIGEEGVPRASVSMAEEPPTPPEEPPKPPEEPPVEKPKLPLIPPPPSMYVRPGEVEVVNSLVERNKGDADSVRYYPDRVEFMKDGKVDRTMDINFIPVPPPPHESGAPTPPAPPAPPEGPKPPETTAPTPEGEKSKSEREADEAAARLEAALDKIPEAARAEVKKALEARSSEKADIEKRYGDQKKFWNRCKRWIGESSLARGIGGVLKIGQGAAEVYAGMHTAGWTGLLGPALFTHGIAKGLEGIAQVYNSIKEATGKPKSEMEKAGAQIEAKGKELEKAINEFKPEDAEKIAVLAKEIQALEVQRLEAKMGILSDRAKTNLWGLKGKILGGALGTAAVTGVPTGMQFLGGTGVPGIPAGHSTFLSLKGWMFGYQPGQAAIAGAHGAHVGPVGLLGHAGHTMGATTTLANIGWLAGGLAIAAGALAGQARYSKVEFDRLQKQIEGLKTEAAKYKEPEPEKPAEPAAPAPTGPDKTGKDGSTTEGGKSGSGKTGETKTGDGGPKGPDDGKGKKGPEKKEEAKETGFEDGKVYDAKIGDHREGKTYKATVDGKYVGFLVVDDLEKDEKLAGKSIKIKVVESRMVGEKEDIVQINAEVHFKPEEPKPEEPGKVKKEKWGFKSGDRIVEKKSKKAGEIVGFTDKTVLIKMDDQPEGDVSIVKNRDFRKNFEAEKKDEKPPTKSLEEEMPDWKEKAAPIVAEAFKPGAEWKCVAVSKGKKTEEGKVYHIVSIDEKGSDSRVKVWETGTAAGTEIDLTYDEFLHDLRSVQAETLVAGVSEANQESMRDGIHKMMIAWGNEHIVGIKPDEKPEDEKPWEYKTGDEVVEIATDKKFKIDDVAISGNVFVKAEGEDTATDYTAAEFEAKFKPVTETPEPKPELAEAVTALGPIKPAEFWDVAEKHIVPGTKITDKEGEHIVKALVDLNMTNGEYGIEFEDGKKTAYTSEFVKRNLESGRLKIE